MWMKEKRLYVSIIKLIFWIILHSMRTPGDDFFPHMQWFGNKLLIQLFDSIKLSELNVQRLKRLLYKVTNIKGLCLLGQAQPCLNRMTVKSQHFSARAHVMWCERHAQRNADAVRVSLVSLRSSVRFKESQPSDAECHLWGREADNARPTGK